MNSFVTKQEKAWGGTFGDQYVGRNAAAELIPPLYAFFSKVLCHALVSEGVGSVDHARRGGSGRRCYPGVRIRG